MRSLAAALAGTGPAPGLFWPAVLARNALFTTGVYELILRRALPPW